MDIPSTRDVNELWSLNLNLIHIHLTSQFLIEQGMQLSLEAQQGIHERYGAAVCL